MRPVEALVRRLYGEAAEGLLGDWLEARARRRVRDGALRAFLWSTREGLGIVARGLVESGRAARVPTPGGLAQEVRMSLRGLRRSPGFSAVAVSTLAVGLGAGTTLFAVADAVLWRPLPYPSSEAIVRIGAVRPDRIIGGRSGDGELSLINVSPVFERALRDVPGFAATAGVIVTDVDLTGTVTPRRLDGAAVSPSLAGVLGMRVALGRWLSDDDRAGSEAVVVLSDGFWREGFGGDPAILGTRLMLGGVPRTVVGVLPAGFAGPEAVRLDDTDVWYPIAQSGRDLEDVGNYFVTMLGRIAPGVEWSGAWSRLEEATRRIVARHPADAPTHEMVVGMARLIDVTVGRSARSILLLFGAAGLLLLIASVNLAHLLLARATTRVREMAIRAALGAGRVRLIRQLVTESVLLALLGGGVGVLLAFSGTAFIRRLHPPGLPRIAEIGVDPRVVAFAFVLSLVVGVSFGLVPALHARGTRLSVGLRQGARGGVTRLRWSLVSVETALAVVLVCAGALLSNSFVRLARVDPGFDPEGVVQMSVVARAVHDSREARVVLFGTVRERLAALPGVQAAGLTNGQPFGGANAAGSFVVDGEAPTDGFIGWQLIDEGFADALGVSLVAGRALTAADVSAGAPVALVNQSFARTILGDDPVGRRFKVIESDDDDPWLTVVGVLADTRPGRLARDPLPEAYVPYTRPGFIFPTMTFIVRSEMPPATLAPMLRAVLRDVDPDQPAGAIATVDERISGSLTEARFHLLLIGAFAVSALLLAATGLYGTLAFAMALRRREMGVRMALGAPRPRIARLVLRQGLAPVGVGLAIGVLVTLSISRLLQGLVFGITTTDIPTYAGSVFLLGTVALVACAVPTVRALRTDPVHVLREE